MKRLDYFQPYLTLLLACLFFLLSSLINRNLVRPYIIISKQEATWNLNNDMIQKFNLGFKRLESSFLWISTIIESDVDHYQKKDLNSWMFLRFHTISVLDPLFYENYAFGGPYLSIIKDDLTGASIIYDKGLKQFPNDFFLLRDAGFHYQFQVGDYKKSYFIYSKLKSNPRSSILAFSTLARLETSQGHLQTAFDLLSSKYNEIKDKESYLAKKIFSHLYAIKAELDLECLNHKIQNCALKDFEGNLYYQLQNGQFNAKKIWESFRIKKKKKSL